jgi:predicted signal transduction protein with EAL and GGDEF domain
MVIFMALTSMILVLVAWEVYRDSALDSQRQSLQEVLARETERVMQQVREASAELAAAIQTDADFRQALAAQDNDRLAQILGQQFQRYHVTSGVLNLVQLYAYDTSYEVVAWSQLGPSARGEVGIICQELLARARQRRGAEHIKILSGLCQWKGRAYFSLIVPVGGIQQQGYLQLVTDPLANMVNLEQFLDMPVRLSSVNGDRVYRSHAWRGGAAGQDFITAHYWLQGGAGGRLTQVSVQHDLDLFNQQVTESRNLLMTLAGVITLVMVLFTLWVLQQSMLRPMRAFINQLNLVRSDRRNLGRPIELPANAELRELVQVFNDMSRELAVAYEEYEDLAFTDQLTALPNRALFLDRLRQLILLSKRKSERFGVMLLDLDSFKEVNDTLGHHLGDELLRHIALRLQRILRASSTIARVGEDNTGEEPGKALLEAEETTVARLGGDEFAFLLPNLGGVDGAVAVARRVTEALEAPVDVDGNLIVVAGTLGLAMFPEHGDSAETLLRRADVALYVAKHIQSDFSVYDPAYDRNSVKQLALKAELRSAIDDDQLLLYYQPKLDLEKGCVASVEALVRWQHPEQGLIPPNQFIPMSEQRGLIGPLTEWVIHTALQQHRSWQEQGIDVKIAVNLSSRVLYDLSLPAKVEQALVKAQLSPAALALEITEEATMLDPERAMIILQRLNEMGISLSIDDFGTGHSSLSYLKRLPVDEIKIDRSFVMEMESSDNDAKIVHATIDLAHNLGLKVVAEGVESEHILSMLKTLNCDYAQGFHLSRPVAADDLVKWLAVSEYRCGI